MNPNWILAREPEPGRWEGRRVASAGDPATVLPLLQKLFCRIFDGDVGAMLRKYVDEHLGWCEIGVGSDRCACDRHRCVPSEPTMIDVDVVVPGAEWTYVIRNDGVRILHNERGDSNRALWTYIGDVPWQTDLTPETLWNLMNMRQLPLSV